MLGEFLNNYKSHIFVTTVVLIHYVLYILLYLNINIISKEYVNIFNAILQASISLFLIFKFWIYYKSPIISDFDRRVIITSATFMLLNAITNGLFNNYENEIRDFFEKKMHVDKLKVNWTQITPLPASPYVYTPIKHENTYINNNTEATEYKNNDKNPIYDYLPDETKIKNKFE
jgi:hypothetical protein